MKKLFLTAIIFTLIFPNLTEAGKYRANGWLYASLLDGCVGLEQYSYSTSPDYSYFSLGMARIAIGLPPPFGFGLGTELGEGVVEIFGGTLPLHIYFVPYANFNRLGHPQPIVYSDFLIMPWLNYSEYLRLGIGIDWQLSYVLAVGFRAGYYSYTNEQWGQVNSIYAGINLGLSLWQGLGVREKISPKTEIFVKKPKPEAPPEKPKPERLSPFLEIVSLTLKDGNNDGVLDAMESGEIYLSVKNKGKGNAYNLKVLASPLENYEDLKLGSLEVEMININETKTIRIPIYAEKKVKTQEVKLRIDVKEPYFGADADPKVLVFSTKRFEPPDVSVAQTGVDDDELGETMGNSNGKIETGETVEITAILQNLGKGISENTKVKVLPITEENIMFLGKETTFSVGNIAPGEWNKVTFPIYVSKRFEGEKFALRLRTTESKGIFTRIDTMFFPLNKPMVLPSEIVVPKQPVAEESVEIEPIPELTADVDLNIPVTGVENKNGIAVIIGCSEYSKPDVPKVEYALRDARIIKEYLINMFGYKEANIIFLRNPTKADLERVFGIKGNPKGQLYNYVKKDESEVFVYYTGHGAPDLKDKNAYFVPSDADPSYIELQGYPLDLFFENLSNVPAKRITVVIDACFSGAYDKGLIIPNASPIVGVKIEKVKGIKDKGAIMTSASETEVASWYPEKRHSLFTYFFLKGLKGEADKNGNKEITVDELDSYVKDNVSYWARRLHNREQNPRFEGEKSSVILRLK